MVTMKNMQYNH